MAQGIPQKEGEGIMPIKHHEVLFFIANLKISIFRPNSFFSVSVKTQ